MNVLIIYFSQTGGTEKIAAKIKEGILDSNNNCDIIKIEKARDLDLKTYDLIGLGTPTFYYREPVNVKDFIQNMEMELMLRKKLISDLEADIQKINIL